MKNIAFIISIIFYFISCNTDSSPLGYIDSGYIVSVVPTGRSQNGFVEFKFSNTLDDTLWYWGYNKNSPLYLTQIFSDTGWVYYGGWCGTGVRKIEFAPYESFRVNVIKPSPNTAWRVGIYTFRDVDGVGEYSWSNIQ
jgi:hypothetical protein